MVKSYSKKIDGENKLSPHFKVREFACEDGSDAILISTELIILLEKLYEKLNCSKIIVNSGFRTPTYDKVVGGNGSGQHTLGKAADIQCYALDGTLISAKNVCCMAESLGVHGIGYISEKAVHVDVRDGHWWGDETTGDDNIRSFYSYFGMDNPSPSTSSHEWTYKYDKHIAELQEILNAKGAKLKEDGIAGDKTLEALKQYTINNGDKGALTKWVQQRLNGLGHNCGYADGFAESPTMQGIAKFQEAHKLGQGYLGGEDWYYLIK